MNLKVYVLVGFLFVYGGVHAADYLGQASLGMVVTGGNSLSHTIEAKSGNTITIDKKNLFKFGGHYTYGSGSTDTNPDEEILNTRNWDANARYERVISKKINIYFGEIVEGDQFANIKARWNTDAGIKYKFIENDNTNFFSEIGLRYSVEQYRDTTPTEQFWKGRLYTEINHKFSESVTGRFWVEYLPNFDESEDWNLNFEPSLSIALNKVFSVQLAYLGQYDNLPVGAIRNREYDYKYTTYLVAKFD